MPEYIIDLDSYAVTIDYMRPRCPKFQYLENPETGRRWESYDEAEDWVRNHLNLDIVDEEFES